MSSARKRKGAAKEPSAPEPPKAAPPAPSHSLRRTVNIGILALAAGLGFYATVYPGFGGPSLSFRERVKYLIPTQQQVVLSADIPKREAIKSAFLYAWDDYVEHGWGSDEYHPIAKKGSNLTAAGGIGYTIVDTIDTLQLMGLDEEVARARAWVKDSLTFERDAEYNTFEVTIRVLGGLLSAHYLAEQAGSPDPIYLERAEDLGNRLLSVFKTPSGLPTSKINLGKQVGVPDEDNRGLVSTAEAATLQLELKYLSQLTGEESYWRAAENVMKVIKEAMRGGLAPIMMNSDAGQFVSADIRLGSRGDSYYEYLLKQYLQTDRTEHVYRDMYDLSMTEVADHLFKESPTSKMIYTSELQPKQGLQGTSWQLVPKQDHLVCFLGGSLLLGVTEGGGSVPPDVTKFTKEELRDWKNGVGLIRTCMETHKTLTGLAPEIAHFRTPNDPNWVADAAPKDWYIKGMVGHEGDTYDARYMLRPETVESLYIAHRLTGHPQYRRWGWDIFQAIQRSCKLPNGGYATVLNVDSKTLRHEDKMETFFLSETLKYLYLLFDDADKISLKDVVFNTEAHPLPVFTPSTITPLSF